MRRSFAPLSCLALLCLLPLAPARAADVGFGVRAGLTSEPDAIFVGGHMVFAGLLPQFENLRFEPSLDIGFGSQDFGPADLDYRTIRANGNFTFPLGIGEDLRVYPLAGLGIYHLSISDCDDSFGGDCSETNFGLNLGAGFGFGGWTADVTVGIGDLPDFTLTAAYTFGL